MSENYKISCTDYDGVRSFVKIPLCTECKTIIKYSAELGGPICYECFISLADDADVKEKEGVKMKSEVKVYTHEELIQGTDSNGQWVDDYNVFDVVAKSDFDKLSLELRKAKREIEVLRHKVPLLLKSLGATDYLVDKCMKSVNAEIEAAREEVT